MARKTEEWIGKTPNTPPPPRVVLRVFERCDGRCVSCGRKMMRRKDWDLDHDTALINEGENRERNFVVRCKGCHRSKTKEDVAEKATIYRKRSKATGTHKSKRPMPGGRNSPWKRTFSGQIIRRHSDED